MNISLVHSAQCTVIDPAKNGDQYCRVTKSLKNKFEFEKLVPKMCAQNAQKHAKLCKNLQTFAKNMTKLCKNA